MLKHPVRRLGMSLLFLTLLGAGAPEFNGCAGTSPSPPPSGTRLPQADASLCSNETDCLGTGQECVRYDCIAGLCVETTGINDADGDGLAALPCGDDCDDGNPLIAPGALELCDRVDNDCDGSIDESISGWSIQTATVPSVRSAVASLGDNHLLATAAIELVFVRMVIGGLVADLNTEAMRLGSGSRFSRIEAERSGDDSAVIFAQTDLGTVLATTVRRDEDDRLISSERLTLGTAYEGNPETLHSFWTTSHRGGAAAALRTAPDTITVYPSVDGTPYTVEVDEAQSLDGFASDGTRLVLMLEPELRFYDDDGDEQGRLDIRLFNLSGEAIGTPFAGSPLASGDGQVYFGKNFTEAAGASADYMGIWIADITAMGERLASADTTDGVGVRLHAQDDGLWVATLSPTLGHFARFLAPGSSEWDEARVPRPFSEPESRVSFAGLSRHVGILSDAGGTSELRIMTFCER